MKITRADELCSIVCDKLCKYPLMANSQEQLEEICADCQLVQAMLPKIRSDANRYECMAGTPEQFADTLMQIQDGTERGVCGGDLHLQRHVYRRHAD